VSEKIISASYVQNQNPSESLADTRMWTCKRNITKYAIGVIPNNIAIMIKHPSPKKLLRKVG
jgi:hypothetical protein